MLLARANSGGVRCSGGVRLAVSGVGKMIKIVFCLRKLVRLTTEQFQRHWLDIHAPLVHKHHQVLRIARYVQFHSAFGPIEKKLRAFRNSPEPYDGVAEIWYESREALGTLGENPEARAAIRELLEDEKRFVDHSRSPIWLGQEKVIISTEGNGRGILP
jgi:EthD domain